MGYETILLERRDAIGIIKLNRTEKRNALNAQLIDEVVNALHEFEADPEVNAIVIMSNHTPDTFYSQIDLIFFCQRYNLVKGIKDHIPGSTF